MCGSHRPMKETVWLQRRLGLAEADPDTSVGYGETDLPEGDMPLVGNPPTILEEDSSNYS